MAIEIDKYTKIVSGLSKTNSAVRRTLVANVFTQNDKVAHLGMKRFSNSDDVGDYFGNDSEEYKFASKYFGFLSKSITRAESIAFSAWNFQALDHEWKFYDAEITNNGVTLVRAEGSTSAFIYESIPEVMETLGDYSVINFKFSADFLTSASSASAAVKNLYADGIHIGELQHVYIDLNGHKFSCLNHCVVNEGFCRIYDSQWYGAMWTTNPTAYEKDAKGNIVPQSVASTIVSTGRLIIDGGWFGNSEADYTYSNCNAGPAVEVLGGEATINGGQYTCKCTDPTKIRVSSSTPPLAAAPQVDDNFVDDTLYSFVMVASGYSVLTINGGTFYGLPIGCLGCDSDTVNDTKSKHSSIIVNGGHFYAGTPRYIDFTTTRDWFCFAWAGRIAWLLLQQDDTPTTVTNAESVIDIRGGTYAINNTGLLANVKHDDIYYVFRGRVAVHKELYYRHTEGDIPCNYNVAEDFYKFRSAIPEYERIEQPVEALRRCNLMDDNFGSFCFLDSLSVEEHKAVADLNASFSYKYLYSIDFAPEECKGVLFRVKGASGTCFTLDKFAAYARFMPMALFAATKYDRANATKVFMYQQFSGEKPSVTTTSEANRYDAFDVDGMGTHYPVNYYGCTQQAGKTISFYQDGYNADGVDTACYCNEIWLKDAIAVELLNTFMAMEKIPANNIGEAIIKNAITTILDEAIKNETITIGKGLDTVQKSYIDMAANEAEAWRFVEVYGYWLKVELKSRALAGGRTQYYADYVLVYSKGDAIRKVEGSDILI